MLYLRGHNTKWTLRPYGFEDRTLSDVEGRVMPEILGCGICVNEGKKYEVSRTTRGLMTLIEHWKKEHPWLIVTSNGTPVGNVL